MRRSTTKDVISVRFAGIRFEFSRKLDGRTAKRTRVFTLYSEHFEHSASTRNLVPLEHTTEKDGMGVVLATFAPRDSFIGPDTKVKAKLHNSPTISFECTMKLPLNVCQKDGGHHDRIQC
ncbi:hypothetical protein GWI33_017196 [Rhynchophorus ferrugineus]|uniref:Uncharacterized protein n=1 Tax=Rhynchophorus ferrugineus TaxID=354439 RepID=A0A834M7W5_RHYFE|nr:hypothetical protein GWI33_017196 [Rhynchophorus ferrugineus]